MRIDIAVSGNVPLQLTKFRYVTEGLPEQDNITTISAIGKLVPVQ